MKSSPKLFSKALLASLYMTHSNKKMNLRSDYKRALLREVWTLEKANRTEVSALFYFVDYLLKLPKEMSEQLQQEMRAEFRKEDERMLESFKGDLPPTLAGILEMERNEGIEQGIRQVIGGLIENGFPDEMIARVANQTMEQVQAIRIEMKLK
ncbi:hypothetical protein [Solibacillus sp. FSL K6-1523]|uniref:hypothetical protein n=1 Tax=Solibacillus sp. FSL K6-1523 TaxID=2921471 RepID=UPI0030F7E4C1